MKFIIATNNKKKLKELSAILGRLGVEAVSLAEAGIESDVEETGKTFEENSRLKAVAAMEIANLPAIADDSGLEVDALGGEPGIYSARYGGDLCRKTYRNIQTTAGNGFGNCCISGCWLVTPGYEKSKGLPVYCCSGWYFTTLGYSRFWRGILRC